MIDIGFDELVLREHESVVLTAVVIDPNGDLVGGELYGPGEPALYGVLTAHPSDRWRGELSWDEVHERWPLRFELEVELPLTVRMVDAEGHVTEATASIPAVCGGLRDTACDGECVDVQVDVAHCGGCDLVCPVAELEGLEPVGGCLGEMCQPAWASCVAAEPGTTCADRCAAEAAACRAGGCQGRTIMAYDDAEVCEQELAGALADGDCGTDLGEDPLTTTVRCCCG